ncbi:hypothetical protein KCU59_g167, partial [Aureobasidium melanogenum]
LTFKGNSDIENSFLITTPNRPQESCPVSIQFSSVMSLLSRPISTLVRQRLILLDPHNMFLTHMLRRNQAIELPQPAFRLLNMELAIIVLVIDMRLECCIDHTRSSAIGLGVVVKTDRNVFNYDADEGFGRLCFCHAANVDVGGLYGVEIFVMSAAMAALLSASSKTPDQSSREAERDDGY